MKRIVAGALLLLLSAAPVAGSHEPPRSTDPETQLAYIVEFVEARNHLIELIGAEMAAPSGTEKQDLNLEIDMALLALLDEYNEKHILPCFALQHRVALTELNAVVEWRAAVRRVDAIGAAAHLKVANDAWTLQGNSVFISLNDCTTIMADIEGPLSPDLPLTKVVDAVR